MIFKNINLKFINADNRESIIIIKSVIKIRIMKMMIIIKIIKEKKDIKITKKENKFISRLILMKPIIFKSFKIM